MSTTRRSVRACILGLAVTVGVATSGCGSAGSGDASTAPGEPGASTDQVVTVPTPTSTTDIELPVTDLPADLPTSSPSATLPEVDTTAGGPPGAEIVGGAAGAPEPGADAGSVSGGGGDSAAVERLEAQIPDLSVRYQQNYGSQALTYAAKLARAVPSLRSAVTVMDLVTDCLTRYGVAAARSYVRPDLSAAGVILVISGTQLQQLGEIAVRCALDTVIDTGDVSGGGPGGWQPCVYRYYYDTTVDGVADRFFVIVAATHPTACADIYQGHLQYTLKAW